MAAKTDVMSVPEVVAFVGCSDVWVIRMLRADTLAGFRLSGRAWAVSRASVEKNHRDYQERDVWLSGRKREGGPKPRHRARSATRKAIESARST